jgi:tubulin gamma
MHSSSSPSVGVLQVVPARASPHLQHPHRVSGLMLANHTAVRHTLDKTVSQFDTLFQRKV